jgi:hypothetical protein
VSSTRGLSYEVVPGGLGPVERDRIFALAKKGLKGHKIARELRKHPATVRWFMYRNGLLAPKHYGPPTLRGGKIVKPFTPEEDAFITALRVQSFGPTEIARLTTKRFGHPRTLHVVSQRLVMLAAREDA